MGGEGVEVGGEEVGGMDGGLGEAWEVEEVREEVYGRGGFVWGFRGLEGGGVD